MLFLQILEVLEKIASYYHLDPESFYEDYIHHYEGPLMDSSLSTAQYVHHLNTLVGSSLPSDVFKRFFTPKVDERVVESITHLREAGHTVVCASNTFEDHWQVIEDMGLFDILIAYMPPIL